MKTMLTSAALGLVFASTALATDTYEIDPSHTQVVFEVERFGFNRVIGTFGRTEGTLMLDMENPANSSVTATVHADTLWSGDATRDEHLRGEHWFDIANNPAITFTSTMVEPGDEENTASVTGDLTFRGQTIPVTFDVRLNGMGPNPPDQRPAAGFSMTGSFLRSDLGHTLANPLIGDELDIRIELVAYRVDAEQE